MEMSSEEKSVFLSHPDVREHTARRHCTPKHLEDYILAYNSMRSALSSHPAETEQRGAAAAMIPGQTDAAFCMDEQVASHSSSSGNVLNLFPQTTNGITLSTRKGGEC